MKSGTKTKAWKKEVKRKNARFFSTKKHENTEYCKRFSFQKKIHTKQKGVGRGKE